MEAHAPVPADQCGSEDLGLVIGKRPRKSTRDFLSAEKRPDKRIGKICVLIGGKMALPGPLAHRVGADRPEIWAAADQPAIAQDDDAAVTASDAVEHVDVDGIKPVPHEGFRRPSALHWDYTRPMAGGKRQQSSISRPLSHDP